MVAKELSRDYGMRQEEVAKLLEVTQSAVSQYTRNLRGRALDLDRVEGVQAVVKDLAYNLANKALSPREVNQRYCEACRIVWELHRRLNPEYSVDECDACMPGNGVCF